MQRRNACKLIASAALAPGFLREAAAAEFKPRYVLASALYGDMTVDSVLAEVKKAGCESVDIWRKVHATQREQIEEMGDDAFQALLKKHGVGLSISTCYPLGPFKQDDEMRWVKKNGGTMTVCGSGSMGDKDPQGAEAKKQVQAFFEKLKPHYELAEELGVTMAIENHVNSMLSHPDSIRYFAELNPSKNVGIAFAPHHLAEHVDLIPTLIREIGNDQMPFIYFQEHHPSTKQTMPKEEELKQLPGRGTLDYVPILKAMKEIQFSGLAEIFMHPTPRGLPVLPTAGEITAVINESRAYLDQCLAKG
jgi:sugar phosphate isomerase/epimerase